MLKRKKQNQQQQQLQQPQLPEREEIGDEEDESRIGPPSLLGPPPMANGKPGDPKTAPNWNPPTCPPSVEWINKLLYVHAMGYYTAMKTNELLQATWMNLTNMMLSERSQTQKNADCHGGPSRGGFHKEQRHPRRLKSWSLVKNTCPPKDGPQVMEDKSDRPVCRHFAKKGHCRYEDLCAFYHPGVNGPPL
ncbi:proline-rich protein 3 isoform X3 [Pteropus alecto]|uniref:proline-rich protein 3 isoform X3 n=1 Tax=Pteropus alecto TaxID=9402 RepID=UPI00076877B3|nr:proline-rich protein 3 isoform X3 [Pteropus alecto]